MHKKIETAKAPKAIGPYSQAVAAQPFLFVSGQLPVDPATGKIVDGDIGVKTRQVLRNIQAILEEAGFKVEDVVRAEIFLRDLKDFQAVNQVYGELFAGATPPARQTIQVAGLPLGSPIEISCIAIKA
jgi:2-iminobutanoate/2-iminopropanoate deaminase